MTHYIAQRFIDNFRPGDNVTDGYDIDQLRRMALTGHVRAVENSEQVEVSIVSIPVADVQPAPVDLAAMKIEALRNLAAGLGITGIDTRRKSDLIAAIETGMATVNQGA